MSLGLSLDLGLSPVATGGGSAPVAGASPSTFATSPDVHYHPNSQTVSVDGSSRLTSCPDLRALAAMIAVAGATAPKLMTDGLGRDFLRFNGSEGCAVENALTAVANRGFMCVMVGRSHHGRNTVQMVNPRFAAYTSPSVNTAANGSIGYLRSTVTSSSAGYLQGGSPAGSTNATDCYKAIPGAQMQVMGVASRTTANGGTRLYINNQTCDVAQQTTSVTGYIGLVIGGTAGASNTENLTVSVNNVFDLYELAFWKGEISNANADAIMAAAVSNYAIPALDTNLVLEGDSITDGINTTNGLGTTPMWSGGLGSRLTEPGAELVAGNVRVINLGTSGNQVSNLVTKRDGVNSVFSAGLYPGGAAFNKVAFQIGRNDLVVTATSAAVHYANVVPLINTTTTGYLQRGWSVTIAGNIATAATAIAGSPPEGAITLQQRILNYRALTFTGAAVHDTFKTDTLTNTGQAFDGLLTGIPLHLIEVSGDTAFSTNTDAADTGAGYYDGDATHLHVEGIDKMANGGDNPAYGYGSLA
jgi:hypothetical protein